MKDFNQKIVLVSGNKSKAAEVAAILACDIEAIGLDIKEIQSLDVKEVAHAKAVSAFSTLKRPVIVDDTGMEISALNGLPGALVSWFLDALGPSGILRLVKDCADRRAVVRTCIAYADLSGVKVFVGERAGTITLEERGTNGFGYDPIFIPDGETKTYAEMTTDEKNAISMRLDALVKLKHHLELQ
jgi:XTP/dITP diphosphohydrolase